MIHKVRLEAELPPSIETEQVIGLAARLCHAAAQVIGHAEVAAPRVDDTAATACVAMVIKAAIEQAVAIVGGVIISLTFDADDPKPAPKVNRIHEELALRAMRRLRPRRRRFH